MRIGRKVVCGGGDVPVRYVYRNHSSAMGFYTYAKDLCGVVDGYNDAVYNLVKDFIESGAVPESLTPTYDGANDGPLDEQGGRKMEKWAAYEQGRWSLFVQFINSDGSKPYQYNTSRYLNDFLVDGKAPDGLAIEYGSGFGYSGERVRLLDAAERAKLASNGLDEWIVLAYPGVVSSTAEVYARCTPRDKVDSGDVDLSAAPPVNDLQAAACTLHPETSTALAVLMVAGSSGVMMSGSGSTVFGFTEDYNDAVRIAATMKSVGCKTWITRPLNS